MCLGIVSGRKLRIKEFLIKKMVYQGQQEGSAGKALAIRCSILEPFSSVDGNLPNSNPGTHSASPNLQKATSILQ